MLTDWLTMITEFIGMTAALSIFGVPPWLTVLGCWLIMGGMIISGRYWTWEKITLVFCVVNLIYIPAAFMVHPSVHDIFKYSFIPHAAAGGIHQRAVFHADGQHRHDHRTLDAVLSAEFRGGQEAEGKGHHVRQGRYGDWRLS